VVKNKYNESSAIAPNKIIKKMKTPIIYIRIISCLDSTHVPIIAAFKSHFFFTTCNIYYTQ
jgi:hypothetical protein